MMTVLTVLFAAAAITGCPDFEIAAPRERAGVVRAVDFGLSEASERNQEAINAALAEAKRVKAGRVELAPGTYRCFDGTGIQIRDLEDFVFDGKGATLVFRRTGPNLDDQATLLNGMGNVEVENCRRAVVRNFNIDWDWERDPLGVWCRPVAKYVSEKEDNTSYVDFELEKPHPKYPAHVPVQTITPMDESHAGAALRPERGCRSYMALCMGEMGAKMQWLSPTRMRVWPHVRSGYGHVAKASEWRFTAKLNRSKAKEFPTNGLYNICHHYYGLNGLVMTSNEDLTVKDVEIWACRGLGVETRGAQTRWELVNVNVRPKPGSRYPVTSTADSHHVVQSKGYGRMVGCEATMHQDDHFNYHDRTMIGSATGPRTIETVNDRGIAYVPFRPGTQIQLRRDDFGDTLWRGRIVKIEGEEITFDRDLPPQNGLLFVMIDCEYATENFLFKDCWFHDAAWSRGLILGNNVTFDGCRFGPMVGSPLRFMSCYTYHVWCEGIGCHNIVVRNCRFENCLDAYLVNGVSSQIYTGMRIPWKMDQPDARKPFRHAGFAEKVRAFEAKDKRLVPARDAISGILVEGNTFVNPRSYLWYVANGDNLVFRNNNVVYDNPCCPLLPSAGRLRVESGTDIDFPPELTDRLAAPKAADPVRDGARLCFLGDSITKQAMWSDVLTTALLTRYPERHYRFCNAGIAGDTAGGSLSRLDEDVTAFRPTDLTVMFGMNDVARHCYVAKPTADDRRQQAAALGAYTTNIAAIATRLSAANAGLRFHWFTPTPYDEAAPSDRTLNPGVEGALRTCADAVRALAIGRGDALIDLNADMTAANAQGRLTDPAFTLCGVDRVHPQEAGGFFMASRILKAWNVKEGVARLAIDAAKGVCPRADGAEVTAVRAGADGVTFTVLEKSLPLPVPPAAQALDRQLHLSGRYNVETLTAVGLADGAWTLSIDGVDVLTTNATAWSAGINLVGRDTPQRRQAARVAALNHERVEIEADYRTMLAGRWYLRKKGVDVDDWSAVERKAAEYAGQKGYYQKNVVRYAKEWKTRHEVRARLDALETQIDEARRPVSRTWRLHRR